MSLRKSFVGFLFVLITVFGPGVVAAQEPDLEAGSNPPVVTEDLSIEEPPVLETSEERLAKSLRSQLQAIRIVSGDIEELEATRSLHLSTSQEMLLPLRWIAILHGRVETSLALTTGVHTTEDVVKALMAGADVTQVCSVLLQEGIDKLKDLTWGLSSWMDEHEYASIEELQGILSHKKSPNAAAFERANYVKLVGQTEV